MRITISILLFLLLFSVTDTYAQDSLNKEQVLATVQLKMVQATKLQRLGNEAKAKALVDESISMSEPL